MEKYVPSIAIFVHAIFGTKCIKIVFIVYLKFKLTEQSIFYLLNKAYDKPRQSQCFLKRRKCFSRNLKESRAKLEH
jgi:hypothetical protein